MLRPIPRQLLWDTVTIKVCTGVDTWQNPVFGETYTVKNVHLQSTNEVRKTKDNAEVVLRSILFIDGRRSTPHLDYDALAQKSQENGKPMRAVVSNASGDVVGDFEVLTVDPVPDVPSTRTHHTEVGMV